MERKILQAKGASIVAGEAVAYGRTSRFYQPLSKEETESLNLLLAQGDYGTADLEQVLEGGELAIALEWQGKRREFSIDPVIVSQAA